MKLTLKLIAFCFIVQLAAGCSSQAQPAKAELTTEQMRQIFVGRRLCESVIIEIKDDTAQISGLGCREEA